MNREAFAPSLAQPAPCGMKGCPDTATHAMIVEAHGDNSTFAMRFCEPHYKLVLGELSKRDDHLYTKYATGAELLEAKVQ